MAKIIVMNSLLIKDQVIKVKTKKSKNYIYKSISLLHDYNFINLKYCLHLHHLHALEATKNIKIWCQIFSTCYIVIYKKNKDASMPGY